MSEKKNIIDLIGMKTGYGLTFSLSGNENTPPRISFDDDPHQTNDELYRPARIPYTISHNPIGFHDKG